MPPSRRSQPHLLRAPGPELVVLINSPICGIVPDVIANRADHGIATQQVIVKARLPDHLLQPDLPAPERHTRLVRTNDRRKRAGWGRHQGRAAHRFRIYLCARREAMLAVNHYNRMNVIGHHNMLIDLHVLCNEDLVPVAPTQRFDRSATGALCFRRPRRKCTHGSRHKWLRVPAARTVIPAAEAGGLDSIFVLIE